MGGELSASPVADGDEDYIASETGPLPETPHRSTGVLRALGREGGVTQWMTQLVMPLRGSLTLSRDKVFAWGSDGRIYAFDKQTGAVYWSIPHGAPFNCQPAVKDSRVYFGSEDGSLFAAEQPTRKLISRCRTPAPTRGAAA